MRIALLGGAAMLAIMVSALVGCGFQAGLSKAHDGIKAMSDVVEPQMESACMARAHACRSRGVMAPGDCPELMVCRKWKHRYTAAAAQVHQGLVHCSRVHRDLKAAGVIK